MNLEDKRKQGRDYYHKTRERRLELNKQRYKNNKDWFYKNHRKFIVKSKYGLSWDEYVQLQEDQKNTCAICGEQSKLAIDHDHKTGKVRGLLCGSCNRALGLFKDNLKTLSKAIKYLKRSTSN